jgi:hypothetical protein
MLAKRVIPVATWNSCRPHQVSIAGVAQWVKVPGGTLTGNLTSYTSVSVCGKITGNI